MTICTPTASEEVLVWINRMPSETTLSVIYPDTPVAHKSVRRDVEAMRTIFATVAGRSF